MLTCTMKFPTESSAKEAGKWLRFFTSGRFTASDSYTLTFQCSRAFVLSLTLDNIGRHIPPVDWEQTEVTIEEDNI